jgi:hypothetical protein
VQDIVENLPDLVPLVKEELSDLLNVVLNREQKEGQSRAEQNALAMAIECGAHPLPPPEYGLPSY